MHFGPTHSDIEFLTLFEQNVTISLFVLGIYGPVEEKMTSTLL